MSDDHTVSTSSNSADGISETSMVELESKVAVNDIELVVSDEDPLPDEDKVEAIEEEKVVPVCSICCETVDASKFTNITNGSCSHSYCLDCVVSYIKNATKAQLFGHLKCPAPECGVRAHSGHIMRLTGLDVEAFDTMKRQCANLECNQTIVLHMGNPKMDCTVCETSTCAKCSSEWHGEDPQTGVSLPCPLEEGMSLYA